MLFSPSCARNKKPIADAVVERVVRWTKARSKNGNPGGDPAVRVLELACGTGEHCAFIAKSFVDQAPLLAEWQPTDKDISAEAAASVRAWSENEHVEGIIKDAKPLNCMDSNWEEHYVGTTTHVFVSNMTHISEWPATIGLLRGAGRILQNEDAGCLFVYGPFKRNGEHTAPSNAEFDVSLRQRNSQWGIRCLDNEIEPEAKRHSLRLVEWVQMPANNLLLVLAHDDS